MLCACSGEQFKFDEPAPESPESLATRDFSASGISSRTGTVDWDSKIDDAQVDEVESTLKEALSLNYEEARALLGRLEYQRGNYDAALQVFQGIDIRTLSSRMSKAIAERTRPLKPRSKSDVVPAGVMSLHSVSLLLEAILLKAKSLEELSRIKDAAKECKMILDVVDSALPNGILKGISEDCKLLEMFHKALELLPKLWIQAGYLDEAVLAYRRALVKPWNLDPQKLASIQKDLASTLLFGGVEVEVPAQFQVWGLTAPKSNLEEAILLLAVLMSKMLNGQIGWDSEIMSYLTFALTISGNFESVADLIEQVIPGVYTRAERWYLLALCYSAAGQNDTALNLVKKISGCSEANQEPHVPSLLLGAKLCSQDLQQAHEGINFAREVINNLAKNQNEHFLVQAHKLLGVCYGNAARVSLSDFERNFCQREALAALNSAFTVCKEDDPEILLSLGLENAIQRNLTRAFNNVMRYSEMSGGSTAKAWKLLALVVSAEQRFKDAEAIVDLALDETGQVDQMENLRLKAVLQISQQQPKQAIETYRVLLTLIQAQKESATNDEVTSQRRLEVEAWLDLAGLYTDLESWRDAELCINRAKAIRFFCPRRWHATGALFQAKARHKEALVAFSVSLSIEPDYIPSIVSTAKVLVKTGNDAVPIARSFLMNALRLEPTNHEAWFNLGMLAKMEGLVQQAADFFQAAHELKLSAPVQSFV
ncbi:protein NPGR1 [Lycium ferocissimum]|uniref:protein NPGR1 n=1 Tax=Lycium ferocissimum TaxID=112874 RepID=UPI00281542A3|nr:protein NPGR1 [Lycium ferocissimum]